MREIIIDLQSSDTWKILLNITVNIISSKDTEKSVHSMSDNVKFTPYNDANKVGNELFESLRSKYQDNLEKSVKGNEIFF